MSIIPHVGRLRASEIAFCVTPYRFQPQQETPVPEIPDECPYRENGPGPCRVVRDHLRKRSTGPCFPLWVCRCQVHRRGYTLYSPGYGPYAQAPLAAVTTEGEPLRVVPEEAATSTAEPSVAPERAKFLPTYLGAAVDAERAKFWPAEAGTTANVDLRYSTQVRRIDRALRGVGDSPELDTSTRLQISQHLGTKLISESDTGIDRPKVTANRKRGALVCRRLPAMGDGWRAVKLLTHAFYLAGVWGLPSFWDSRTHALRTEPFRRPGTGGLAVE